MSKPKPSNSNFLTNKLKIKLIILVLLLGWHSLSSFILPKYSLIASDLTIDNIIRGVNKERAIRNLLELNTDQRLSFAAQFKSEDMQNRRYFSHADPEGNYIWNKIVESGYTPYLQLGENLAIEFNNTESLVNAWINSPTHRANVLHDGFKDQGMGLAFGVPSIGQYYSAITNIFGSLLPQKKPEQPVQKTEHPPQKNLKTEIKGNDQQNTFNLPKPEQITQPVSSSNQNLNNTDTQKIKKQDYLKVEQPRSGPSNTDPLKITQNFSLPPLNQQPAIPETPLPEPKAIGAYPTKAPSQFLTTYQVNRYAMLAVGIVLILMVIHDLKKMLEEKFHAYDKKINNLILLMLSLIVVGLMYWL